MTDPDTQQVSLKETSQPNEEKQPSWGEYLIVSVEQMIIVFGIYALSIGPMYWSYIEARDATGPKFIEFIYRPLWYLAGAFPPLADILNWYVRLWIF